MLKNRRIGGAVIPRLQPLALLGGSLVNGTPSSGTIGGATATSTITASGLPTGLTINGAARTWAWDGTGAPATSSFTLTETLVSIVNSPNVTTINYTIYTQLGALTFSATTFITGTPASGTINGATAGSTITASGLPSGLTINGAARTWAWSGTGTVSSSSFALTETYAGANNSPRSSIISYSISAGAVAPALKFNVAANSQYVALVA